MGHPPCPCWHCAPSPAPALMLPCMAGPDMQHRGCCSSKGAGRRAASSAWCKARLPLAKSHSPLALCICAWKNIPGTRGTFIHHTVSAWKEIHMKAMLCIGLWITQFSFNNSQPPRNQWEKPRKNNTTSCLQIMPHFDKRNTLNQRHLVEDLHIKGLTLLWMCLCCLRPEEVANVLPHSGQAWARAPTCWERMCLWRLLGSVKTC